MNRFAAILFAFAAAAPIPLSASGPVVKTAAGALAGHLEPKTQVAAFKGIPFAAPPVGELRWREPQPVKPWDNVRDATTFAASPMQRVHGDFLPWTAEYLVQNEVSEDCLYLNVWTPRPTSSAKLPVVVYIPGGAFWEGSGAVAIYDGANLAAKDLVVVTVNYRLGAFGFLAHPELTAESPHGASGNYGLLDQIAALQWVRENIVAFGGDPARVTVWGQSAGAFSVGALLASPRAKGLFHRTIASSGLSVAGLPMKDLRAAEADGAAFAAEVGARTLTELRAIPAAALLGPNRFRPIVDGWVLSRTPAEILAAGAASDVPVMTGYMANDALMSLPRLQSLEEYETHVTTTYAAMAGEFRELYPVATLEAARPALLHAARDRQRVATLLWARLRLPVYRSPTYTYMFTRGVPWPQHPEFGAFHSGELPYFFDNLHVLDRPWQSVDRTLAETASRYLVQFATNGDPNGAGRPRWNPADTDRNETFELGELVRMSPVAEPPRHRFWSRYFESQQAAKGPVF